MTLNVNSLLCPQCYVCCDQRTKARITHELNCIRLRVVIITVIFILFLP